MLGTHSRITVLSKALNVRVLPDEGRSVIQAGRFGVFRNRLGTGMMILLLSEPSGDRL